MANRKIVVNHEQSIAIHKVLKADKGDTTPEDFIKALVDASGVEEWVAEKFASAWRWNHRNDATATADGSEPAEPKREPYYIEETLPVKKAAGGDGVVAQIHALCAQGKSTADIIALGFNKSTVYRQAGEWRKKQKSKAVEVVA